MLVRNAKVTGCQTEGRRDARRRSWTLGLCGNPRATCAGSIPGVFPDNDVYLLLLTAEQCQCMGCMVNIMFF